MGVNRRGLLHLWQKAKRNRAVHWRPPDDWSVLFRWILALDVGYLHRVGGRGLCVEKMGLLSTAIILREVEVH